MIRVPTNIRPSAKILVAERQSSASRGTICRDGVDVRYRPEVLTAFFFRKPTNRILDLLRVLAAVAHADRRVVRRHSVCWGRDIELSIPVSEPDLWSKAEPKLSALLYLLSGDNWSFSFRHSKYEFAIPGGEYLAFPPNGELATAYSNGLDSFSIARLVASGEIKLSDGVDGKKNLVLVTTGQKLHLSDTHIQFGYRVRQVSVPFTISRFGKSFQLREFSYRTRAFVFQTLAALAAMQTQSNTVIVGEAGQGSLGPWLTVTGQEVADLRTHPFFTEALSEFLRIILQVKVRFEHPLLWKTKGEVLSRLVSANLHGGWDDTRSCAVQVRHQQASGHRLHCGLCPNCLLRRQSLMAAGLQDPDSKYDHSCIVEEDSSGGTVQRQAAQGLMPLIEFASIRQGALGEDVVGREVRGLAEHLHMSLADTNQRLDNLITLHRTELQNFLGARPARSILRQIGEVLL